MIARAQLEALSNDFQIDTFTVFREYLQLVFLNYLYREKQSEQIYFKGGTCIRFFYSSPRFSEDLDFSTTLSKTVIDKLLRKVLVNVQKEVFGINLGFLWQEQSGLRYRLQYQGTEFKYPLGIRVDFSHEATLMPPEVSNIKNVFPITALALAVHLKKEEIFAEKIRAFLMRAKGRDIFDLWHLLENHAVLEEKILQKKLKVVNLTFNKERFLEKIKKYPEKKLTLDIAKFLPKHFRKAIPLLKEKILMGFS